ncbi:protein-methionine-sulfoxide reductase heme-binding subunit MsrQ [Thiosulfatimonas sediminis]|uniref:Protein-methionine-sulfoxide reductase heme-binding subunit MsrQ n=1 Tax=Thiosulfatimonas sediminis TaxID=2675054 RepID=A0A6F8PXF6_9GAMM|nr:protein-methionine-sulfoxide reductase heme-binding subunit MsrQ [Thiosulfatimonas sediminis]BBP46811.1 protein-methionine-sulfoxide reductase heme-binding subunit MsrQ [Thiosulfatimonas sediminis]
MPLFIKLFIVSLICALPAGLLTFDLLTDNLGANPVETLEHTTGDWTIYFLLLTLSITPIQKLFSPKWWLPMHLTRRVLGLSAFVYALLHLAIYFVFDMSVDLNEALTDIAERPFILIGMLALFLLIPLAITSTQGWQRRLKRHWQTLHKLVYLITFLGILHYALLVKADLFMPLLYMTLFGILMLMRQFKLPRLR